MQSRIRVVLLSVLLTLTGLAPVVAQFRGHEWGASREEVAVVEGDPISTSDFRPDEYSMTYNVEISSRSAKAIFTFDDTDGLYRGRYEFEYDGDEVASPFIYFLTLEDILRDVYGLQSRSRSIEEVLPAFQYKRNRLELAVTNGDVYLFSEWWLEHTVIRHSLSYNRILGDPLQPYHSVTYKSRSIVSNFDQFQREGL